MEGIPVAGRDLRVGDTITFLHRGSPTADTIATLVKGRLNLIIEFTSGLTKQLPINTTYNKIEGIENEESDLVAPHVPEGRSLSRVRRDG